MLLLKTPIFKSVVYKSLGKSQTNFKLVKMAERVYLWDFEAKKFSTKVKISA